MRSYIKYPSAAIVPKPWSLPDLCRAYQWPTGLVGGGTIAPGELGGGYLTSDIEQFCKMNNLPVPKITDVSVNGGTNNGDPTDPASGEVALDIQVALAAYSIATGKPADIYVYFAGNTVDAIPSITDRAREDGRDALSWSWGAFEEEWGRPAAVDMESVADHATSTGMAIFAAAGDNDSSDSGPGAANVDLPASCPHVVGCGGTQKTASLETVWNENPGNADGSGTGGGFSKFFPMSSWMSGAPHGMRMVPDVAAVADPRTGYEIVLGGQVIVVGGTSAVAPLYAGLFAALGTKLGHVAPKLWANHMAFNDIVKGDNGRYRARVGPDPCTGLGSPIGAKIAALFPAK